MRSVASNVLERLDDHQVQRIARDIAEDGLACLPQVFSADEIEHARIQAVAAVERAGGEYTSRVGSVGLDGAILGSLSSCPGFLQLCHSLCRLQGINVSPGLATKQVLRCLAGTTGLDHAYYFHFDSFDLTAVVPIVMPSEGQTGDLLLLPNYRSNRSSYLLNALEKFVCDRPTMQARLKRRALNSAATRRIRLEPGNLYFFNGNRTLHANEECDPTALRVTLVVHYAETFQDHWIRRMRRIGAA